MAYDVSGFGFTINVIASNTFPAGFPLTAFADDVDPFDMPSVDIVDTAMGVNGDMIWWSRAIPLKCKVAVIDGSEDDLNLQVLYELNRVGRGKTSAADIITVTAVYPSGKTISLTGGKLTGGMPSSSVASSGRVKTKTYDFSFEGRAGTGG